MLSKRRRLAAWLVLVLAVVLTPITMATRWATFQVSSEEQFVDTLGPLADDPAVQQAIADRITQVIFDNVDVAALAEEALPEQAAFLAGPMAAGVESFTHDQALSFLQSEEFSGLWDAALQRAHQVADALLTGKDDGAIHVDGGQVVVDLSAVTQAVVDRLIDRGLTFAEDLPAEAVTGQLVLFESEALADAQALVELLSNLSWMLLVLALGCFGVSVVLLRDRRRGLVRAGLGLAVGALVLGVVLAVGRTAYLDAAVSAGADRTVQEIVFDQIVSSLQTTVRLVFVLGLVIALASWLLGPSPAATRLRSLVTRGVREGAEGVESAGVGDQAAFRWLGRSERLAQGIVLGLAGLAFIVWPDPTAGTVAILVLVAALVIAVVAVLARAGRHAGATTPTSDPNGSS